MKKVIHVCAGWECWNGAANVARMIAREQEAAGHDVVLKIWACIEELKAADEVWVHCGWLPCLWWSVFWGKNVQWMPAACYDPVRLKYHGWKKWLVGPIERWCLRRCVKIVATCEAEKRWIEAYLGKKCPPVEVTDIRRFFNLPVVQAEPLAKDMPIHLLYLGRRHPLKGLEFLEEAIKDIPNVQLRIVSNAFGEDKDAVWQWADCLVLPTLSDNFGLVIAEALEKGKRVITTDGAPAWCDGNTYGGRLTYIKGYRDGSRTERVALLRTAILGLHANLHEGFAKNLEEYDAVGQVAEKEDSL